MESNLLSQKISKPPEEKFETHSEKIRIKVRRKAQKKGFSIATKKNPKPGEKPIREYRKVTKKRSSVR
jgi:hypothetical protein